MGNCLEKLTILLLNIYHGCLMALNENYLKHILNSCEFKLVNGVHLLGKFLRASKKRHRIVNIFGSYYDKQIYKEI